MLAYIQNLSKLVYGEPIEIQPEENTFAEALTFSQANRTGDKFIKPLERRREQGFTYNADFSAATLQAPKDAQWDQAQVQGSEIIGRAQISYGNMAKLSVGQGDSKKAYVQAVGQTIKSAMESAEVRREIALMYGPGTTGLVNLGVVNTVVSAVGTALTVTITRATWAPGLWPLLEGAGFDFHTSGGVSHTANAEMVLTGTGALGQCRLSFTGNATDVGTVAPGDVITFRDSRTKSAVGIQGILENTGTLFNINAANTSFWKASTYNVAGALTFDKVVESLVLPSNYALKSGGTLFLTAAQWTDCMTDEAALRRHVGDKMAKEVKTGASSLEYESAAGVVKIVRHLYMKQGQAWFIPTEFAERIGESELTFKLPGSKNDWAWHEVSGVGAAEIRCYASQAPFISRPNLCVQLTGISSTADSIPS